MGMSSSRRYGSQEITLTTTSTRSDWAVFYTKTDGEFNPYEAFFNIRNSTIPIIWTVKEVDYEVLNSEPIFDLSSNTGSEIIKLSTKKEGTIVFAAEDYSLNITELDISKNKALYYLLLKYTQLSELDVSENNLYYFICTNNPNLTTIYVNQNQLDKLNGVIPRDLNWTKDAHTKYVLKQ